MKKIARILLSLSLPAVSLSLVSCESGGPLFDNEGDCSTKVQFVFKKHRQALHQINGRETDAFYATVPSVHLFIYDNNTGELVLDRIEKTENLKSAAELGLGSTSDKSFMQVDLDPGDYKLIAWCGLDENDHNNAFSLNEETRGRYKHASVKKDELTGHPLHLEKYEGLYHGKVESAVVTVTNSSQIIPVELTKNNNDISVMVQHTNASLADGDYSIVYTDKNGTMNFETNAITSDDILEYHPHTTTFLTSDAEYNGSTVEAGAMIGHLSTSRLMKENMNDARIEVRDKNGKAVFSIPFIKYVTNMQTFTNDHQYYLDCEDTYNCTFYLTGGEEDSESGLWLPLQIIINNWVIVPDQDANI